MSLADLVVAVHVAYVAFVALGLVAVLLGGWRGWAWVRNPWFRLAHLIAIVIVAVEAIGGLECPLTAWERQLRSAAGEPIQGGTFVGRLLHGLIFVELPAWGYTVLYLAMTFVIGVAFWCVPPRWTNYRTAS